MASAAKNTFLIEKIIYGRKWFVFIKPLLPTIKPFHKQQLIPNRNAISAHQRNAWLDSPRLVDSVRKDIHNLVAALLVETKRMQVVVGGDQLNSGAPLLSRPCLRLMQKGAADAAVFHYAV